MTKALLLPQVTEGKSKVEKALKLTKKLRKEFAAVQDFINRSNQELDKRELTVTSANVNKEIAFAKVGCINVEITHAKFPPYIIVKIVIGN